MKLSLTAEEIKALRRAMMMARDFITSDEDLLSEPELRRTLRALDRIEAKIKHPERGT